MGGAMTVVMVVMMGGMLIGAAWAFVRRASRAERLNEPTVCMWWARTQA